MGFSRAKKLSLIFLILAVSGIVAYSFLPDNYQVDQVITLNFQTEQQVSFNEQIRPIINKKCISCHGGVKRSGEFSLLFASEALEPNESGKPAIVPGHPDESEMIRRITHTDPEVRMPPEGDPLSEEEIELLTTWIEQGAKWEEHWAFVKPAPVKVPAVSSAWARNSIDLFVLDKLVENGLTPSARADKATLLRRLSLDLTGLPPSWQELQRFLKDTTQNGYEHEVDRLLASPRFGEHWAAMWMDLARYADSKGYEKDAHRSIWQYRDWLIKSFNEDKPYDQFTVEQLAGDLLPNPTDDQLIATAFHRNTMNNDEGGTDDEEFRVASVLDRVNTTWKVWQGTTMECVQCHSHPYDPIRHEDYYKSYAFFNNTADADVPSESPTLKTFTTEEDQARLEEIRQWVAEQIPSADEKNKKAAAFVNLARLAEPKIHPHSFDQIEKGTLLDNKYLAVEAGGSALLKQVPLQQANRMLVSYQSGKSAGRVEVRKNTPGGELLASWDVKENKNKGKFEIISIPIKAVAGNHDVFFVFKGAAQKAYVCTIEWVLFYQGLPGEREPRYPEIEQKFLGLINSKETTATPVMVELGGGYKRTTHVFERGNWMVHGDEVAPGVPEAWNALPDDVPANRLGFSQWLIHEDNPLTARVMVNRLWAQLFGRGIVETQEDFGSQGFAPSHPALLDWLAHQFMYQHNWSIKKQLKQIVLSAAYQQSSKVTPELVKLDPANYLLARGPRLRLTAEQVRDQALFVSGLLSDKMYGPSVMPLQPDGVWQVVYSGLNWITSPGEDQYRRALYTYWRRTSPYPSMITFDGPSREFCVPRRITTNTPLQALTTLNDEVYLEAAQALAQRMMHAGRVEEQIKQGYRLAMVKEIDPAKLHDLQQLYKEALLQYEKDPEAAEKMVGKKDAALAALTVVANAIMNLDEFLTKS